jgi:RNA polymerase sigma factor (sigma-70 family)
MRTSDSSSSVTDDAAAIREISRQLRRRFPLAADLVTVAVRDALTKCRLESPLEAISRQKLYVCARNAVLNELRRRNRLTALPAESDASHRAEFEDLTHEDRLLDVLLTEQLLAELTSAQAEAVRLHYMDGHTTRELAARFNISENAVKERLKTALRKVRKFVRRDEARIKR